MEKTRVIRFRLGEHLYSYIFDLVIEMKKHDERWNISEFLRMIISYFLMAQMMGDINKPFWQVKKEFMAYTDTYFPPKSKKRLNRAQKRPRRQSLIE